MRLPYRLFWILICASIVFGPRLLSLVALASLYAALAVELLASAGLLTRPASRLVALTGNGAIGIAALTLPLPLIAVLAVGWSFILLVIVLAGCPGNADYHALLAMLPPAGGLILTGIVAADPVRWQSATQLALLLLAVGTQDLVAMVIGRRWPMFRPFRAISPGKTLSGSISGLMAAISFSWFSARWLGADLPLLRMLPVLLFAQLGDLYFSNIKRALGIKDFSTILGEKGGLLDRADSTIFALLASVLLPV